MALLPDREIATVQTWLSAHPGIEVVSRDRGGGYGEAVARALPDAVQVADRWHLMENASTAFFDAVRKDAVRKDAVGEDAVGKSMRAIRVAVGATVLDPKLLTCAERLQYEGYLRREDTTTAAIRALAEDGLPINTAEPRSTCLKHASSVRPDPFKASSRSRQSHRCMPIYRQHRDAPIGTWRNRRPPRRTEA